MMEQQQLTKPPWKARDPRERQQMIDWVIRQLEWYLERTDGITRLTRLERSNMNCFYEPNQHYRGRPIHRNRDAANAALDDAVDTVPLIREIWQDEYGRKNRHPDDVSAEEIAATLFAVNIAHVISRSRKPSGGPRGRKAR
jgi:hypothetical protein